MTQGEHGLLWLAHEDAEILALRPVLSRMKSHLANNMEKESAEHEKMLKVTALYAQQLAFSVNSLEERDPRRYTAEEKRRASAVRRIHDILNHPS